MLKWQEHYKSRIVSAEEAVKCIKSGDRVVLGHACGEPKILPEAMVNRASELEDVEVVHMLSMRKGLYARPEMAGHFRPNSFFIGPATRQGVKEGWADYTPCFFYDIPRLFREKYLPVDVAMVTITPPDRLGFCSLGISVDYTLQAINSAKIVIAEVNPNMPRTYGNSHIRLEQIDYFVPSEEPIAELEKPAISEIEKQIAHNVAPLIDDGATLQLGIGGIPDAVLNFLTGKHNLGIHSEMFSDGVMELAKQGVINCSQKKLHPGKMVVSFLMGTKELYKWVNENPMVEMYPVDYVNDPYVIAQNDNMVTINSALQIDLLGQIAADTLGSMQFSGVGGQVDFVRGAARAKGGKSIIALPSTAEKGSLSRIVAGFDRGTAVTTSRNEVDYVVTEYGIAALRGKSVKERMQALINIAHPDFKTEIMHDAKFLYFDN